MKKIILLSIVILFGFGIHAQQASYIIHPKLNQAVKRPGLNATEVAPIIPAMASNRTVAAAPLENVIGTTRYDLPSNQATQNRLYRFPDGTIGATWTFGLVDPGFADRGTGYNYFDGTSWGPNPTQRIESIRTGWPSYVPYGANGEAVLAHDFGVGNLTLSKRDTKGSGSWNQSVVSAPATCPIAWPRMISSGVNHDQFHLLAITKPVASGGSVYEGLDGAILYSRSTNGGQTWDIQNVVLPGMTSTEYVGFEGDTYTLAEPKNNTLAFVVGDNWNDLFLMKSTDNGTTWSKTTIFEHPYPMFKETTTLVTDTPTVCDGAVAVALDNSGKAHVFFGLMRVLNDDLTDGTTSYFPYTDGLAYWNEDMPAFPTLNFDTLFNHDQIVGYVQDINGNDTIMEFVDIGKYFLSLTSMPNVTIDENNDIYLVFTSVMENLDNGNQNYRHIWTRASFDEGATWTGFQDLTGSIIHNFDECVFPSLSPTSGTSFLMLFQADEEPGLAVRGDEDPYTDNSMILSTVTKWVSINELPDQNLNVSELYPNPASNQVSLSMHLDKAARVEINTVNMTGQNVGAGFNQVLGAGDHVLNLDLDGLSPGVYFYTIHSEGNKINRKLIIQ